MTRWLAMLAVAPLLSLAGSLADSLAAIAKYEASQPRTALAEFEAMLRESMSEPERVRAIESGLVRLLEGEATLAGKDFACRQLRLIGTDASVPVLARLLARAETATAAHYALARIPGAAADQALRAALPRLDVIRTLGARRVASAVPALQKIAVGSDKAAASAAVAALGDIGTVQALKALATVSAKSPAVSKVEVSRARLEAAYRTSSIKTLHQLSGPAEHWTIRVAALSALSSLKGDAASALIEQHLESHDPRIQAHAVTLLPDTVLVRACPALAPLAQVRVLTVLAQRNARAAQPVFERALASADPEVRIAALNGLGSLGSASTLMLLAKAAAAASGAEQEAARSSLYRLGAAEADAALVAALRESTGTVRLELIRAAGERGATAAAEVLFQAAADSDRQVRREVLRALRETTGPKHVQPLLDLVLNASTAADRTEAARPLAGALKRSDSASLKLVAKAYGDRTEPPVRAALLDVFGQVGSAEALPLLRGALRDTDAAIGRAAILALTNWPTTEPMQDLLALAREESNPARQVLALRGYINLISLPAARPHAESAKLLATALQLSRQIEEKRAVLALLPRFPCKESLDVAEIALRDKSVLNEARLAYGRVSRAMAQPK